MTVSWLGAAGMSSCLCCVTWAVRPPFLLDFCLPTEVSSSGFLWLVGTGLESFLREGGSPWKSWSTIRLGSMPWRLHKLVSCEAASFVSADNHYGLGCPEQEWANGLEKNQHWNSTFFPFFFWKRLNQQRKNALKERLKRLGEYGEVSRQFNVQIFPLLLSFHAWTSRRPRRMFSVLPSPCPALTASWFYWCFQAHSCYSPTPQQSLLCISEVLCQGILRMART